MDKSNIITFINREKQKLYDIQTGLTPQQQIKYNPQIREIVMLLDILKNQKLNPSIIKKIEDKVKDATKILDTSTKQEQLNRAKNYSVLSNVKSNIKNISGETRQKAQMAKASAIAHDKNFEEAQDYLDQMDVPYKIDTNLSNKESLVLTNPEGDVKISYRGTKWNNLGDIKTNLQIITGQEEGGDQYNEAMEQVNKIKTKYGKLPNELIGFSKGSALGLNMGEKFGINTTSFNPFLGKKLINDIGNSKNTIIRTATDLPSMGIGLKNSNPNYDIQVIDAVKGTPNPIKAHSLDNFIDNNNIQLTDHELTNILKKQVAISAKHGEAQVISDMASFIEGSKPIKISKDLYNTKAKIRTLDPAHPNLGHNTREPGIYDIGEQIEQLPESIKRKDFSKMKEIGESRSITDFSDQELFPGVPKKKIKKIKKISKDPLGQEIKARERNIFEDSNVKIPEGSIDPLGQKIKAREKNIFFDEQNIRLPVSRNKSIEQLQKEAFGIFNETGDEPDFKPEDMEAYDGLLDRNNTKTFTDFIHDFNSEKGIDTKINQSTGKTELNSSRMHNTSRWKRMWDEATDGDFTEQEKLHFKKYSDEQAEDFHLSDTERKKLYNSTPDERFNIVKDYEQDALDTQQQMDNLISTPNEDGTESRAITNEFSKSAKNFSQNLLIGAAAQFTADTALNLVDPNHTIPKDARLGLGGALGGTLGEAGILRLGGTALSGAALLPAAIGGGVGNIVGSEVGEAIKKSGGTELESDVGSASAGVASAVYTTGVIAAGASALLGAEEGATLGSIFLPGAGTLIGGISGSLIGLAAYGVSKGWKSFKSLF